MVVSIMEKNEGRDREKEGWGLPFRWSEKASLRKWHLSKDPKEPKTLSQAVIWMLGEGFWKNAKTQSRGDMEGACVGCLNDKEENVPE